MRCSICAGQLDSNSKGTTCSEICAEVFSRREKREIMLASERRFGQCQICFNQYSAARGDGEFCSRRCRQVVWGSWVA